MTYMLKLYLKRIMFVDSVLKEYKEISDTELIKKLSNYIKLYLNELDKTKNENWC